MNKSQDNYAYGTFYLTTYKITCRHHKTIRICGRHAHIKANPFKEIVLSDMLCFIK